MLIKYLPFEGFYALCSTHIVYRQKPAGGLQQIARLLRSAFYFSSLKGDELFMGSLGLFAFDQRLLSIFQSLDSLVFLLILTDRAPSLSHRFQILARAHLHLAQSGGGFGAYV